MKFLPEDFPFQNEVLNKDAIKKVMTLIYDNYDNQKVVENC